MLFYGRELGRLMQWFRDMASEISNAAELPHEIAVWKGGHAVLKIESIFTIQSISASISINKFFHSHGLLPGRLYGSFFI